MKPVTLSTDTKENYLNDFETFSGLYGNNFHTLRKKAIQAFEKTGLPAPKSEEWKYLNLAPVFAHPFVIANPSVKHGGLPTTACPMPNSTQKSPNSQPRSPRRAATVCSPTSGFIASRPTCRSLRGSRTKCSTVRASDPTLPSGSADSSGSRGYSNRAFSRIVAHCLPSCPNRIRVPALRILVSRSNVTIPAAISAVALGNTIVSRLRSV